MDAGRHHGRWRNLRDLSWRFDLSAASGFALCAVVAAALATKGWPPEIDFLAALVVGIVIGAVNAFLVVGLKINPFIATLGSAFILSGVPFVIVDNPFIMVQQPGFDTLGAGSWFGIPFSGMVLIGFLTIAGIVLAKTPTGNGSTPSEETLKRAGFSESVWDWSVASDLHIFWVLHGRRRRRFDITT